MACIPELPGRKLAGAQPPPQKTGSVLEEPITICQGDHEPKNKPASPAPAGRLRGTDATHSEARMETQSREVCPAGSAGPLPHLLQLEDLTHLSVKLRLKEPS